MQLGTIGLGRMGAMVQRLLRDGRACVVHDVQPSAVAVLVNDGAAGAASQAEMVSQLCRPRTIRLMLPEAVVDLALGDLPPLLDAGDIVDGGNSHYLDDMRRGMELKARGVHYLDVGISGGVAGLERGYCLMIGGEAGVVEHLWPIVSSLAPGIEADPELAGYGGRVSDSGEGHWTIQAAIDEGAAGAGPQRRAVRALRVARQRRVLESGPVRDALRSSPKPTHSWMRRCPQDGVFLLDRSLQNEQAWRRNAGDSRLALDRMKVLVWAR